MKSDEKTRVKEDENGSGRRSYKKGVYRRMREGVQGRISRGVVTSGVTSGINFIVRKGRDER